MSTNRDRLIAEGLIKIADRCSEALAGIDAPGADMTNARDNIAGINLLVWQLRWDIGPSGGCTELAADLESEAQ